MSFTVRTEQSPGITTLYLVGELDLATGPELQRVGRQALAGEGIERLVLDADGLEFVDSAGIGALLQVRQATPDPVVMSLVNARGQVLRTLQLTGLSEIFGLADPTPA